MNKNLIEILIEKKVIKRNTIITCTVKDYSTNNLVSHFNKDLFVIRCIKTENDEIKILGLCVKDNKQYYINSTDIKKIDGMELEKIAKVYGLNIDGTPMTQKRKRGRKPKVENIDKYIKTY
ncbi:MAG: hypothetical protein NZZ41_00410 [Candidatus Dojkabacteria bacterium]|nr:hypothetical protein [Candidatus Dojkabacteria bacterium]